MSQSQEKLLWSLFWAFILIFLSLWIASFAAEVYIFASILSVFIEGLDPFLELCMKGINFPLLCANNMKTGQSLNETVDQIEAPQYQNHTNEPVVPSVSVTIEQQDNELRPHPGINQMTSEPATLHIP